MKSYKLSPAETNAENIAKMLSAHCAILLKRRTSSRKIGVDTLYTKERSSVLKNHRSQNMVQAVFYRLLLFLTLL
jgi:hydroxymethylpyrimidine/phosphomethylpyrimidine kinase